MNRPMDKFIEMINLDALPATPDNLEEMLNNFASDMFKTSDVTRKQLRKEFAKKIERLEDTIINGDKIQTDKLNLASDMLGHYMFMLLIMDRVPSVKN